MSTETKVYAVCGKGGVGKTAFTAMLAGCLANKRNTGRLLLIDADPALGLINALGVKIGKTIGQVREALLNAAESGSEEDINEIADKLDYMIFESMVECDDYSVLAMGRSESRGCYCSVNNLLKDAISSLSSRFDTILIDGEAGLEQINRQVVESISTLMLLTDGSARGMQTVRMLEGMVNTEHLVKCGRIGVVFTKVRKDNSYINNITESLKIPVLGCIPDDTALAEYDVRNLPLSGLPQDNPAFAATAKIVEVL